MTPVKFEHNLPARERCDLPRQRNERYVLDKSPELRINGNLIRRSSQGWRDWAFAGETAILIRTHLGELFAAERKIASLRASSADAFRFSEATLRRAIPVLIITFLVLFAAAASLQLYSAYRHTLAQGTRQLALSADAAVHHLMAGIPTRSEALPKQSGASDSGKNSADGISARLHRLPAHLHAEGRSFTVVTATGTVLASTAGRDGPLNLIMTKAARVANTQAAPAQAGLTGPGVPALQGGEAAFVQVRSLGDGQGKLIVVQSRAAMLGSWRRDLAVTSTLFAASSLVLLLLGYAYYWQSGRTAQASGSLRITRDRLDRALERGRCGLWDWDIGRGHIYWSASMFEMLGLDIRDGPMGFGDVIDRLHPEDRNLYEQVEELLKSGGTAIDNDIRLRRADGDWLWLRARAELVHDDAGENPRLIGIAIDITEQKHADKRSEQADRRLALAIENLSEAFVLWDRHDRLVMCNTKYQKFHKLPDRLVQPGTRFEEIDQASAVPVMRSRITENAGNGNSFEIQLKDGRWLQINERRTEDGGFVSVGTDITALKVHEERLLEGERELMATVQDLQKSRAALERQTQKMAVMADRLTMEKTRAEEASRSKSAFLANMSHEFRTPLNAIIGFSEMMLAEVFGAMGSEKYREYCDDIRGSGQYLLEVINAILDMSKIEAGRTTLSISNLLVNDLVNECLRIIAPKAAENGLNVSADIDAGISVAADRRALKQVLINLLSNAVKFTPASGAITISAEDGKDEVVIRVADTGIGIPADEIDKLCRPFEQVENEYTRSRSGSGLGLAISLSLIELHAGTLKVESGDGGGTTVVIALPHLPAAKRAVIAHPPLSPARLACRHQEGR